MSSVPNGCEIGHQACDVALLACQNRAALTSATYFRAQPEGPSWQIDGHRVQWQQWDLRVGFNYREGLVLHQVGCVSRGCTLCAS
jgi:Copper amine oxidase, enzyme domain